jgi:hypothetical protein
MFKEFLLKFVVTFVIALIVGMVATIIWNTFVENNGGAVDWKKAFSLAFIIGITLPLRQLLDKKK